MHAIKVRASCMSQATTKGVASAGAVALATAAVALVFVAVLDGGPRRKIDDFSRRLNSSACAPVPKQPIGISPTCTACAGLRYQGPDKCKYNLTDCQGVAPGESCKISCALPFVGTARHPATVASCIIGNSNPAKLLTSTSNNETGSIFPECECPDPKVLPPGYERIPNVTGGFRCKDGFAPEWDGAPVKKCGCNEEHGLVGCAEIKPCAPPNVDECKFDTSSCQSVQPGESCILKCKEPQFTPGLTEAHCKPNNTNPLTELAYYPLWCGLVDCVDPVPAPPGYNLTAEGWVCANGWNGKVKKECATGVDWHKNCTSETVLTGCKMIVNCFAPALSGLDACAYDVASCTSIDPNSTCDIRCKSPYEGLYTTGYCPNANTDKYGLIWTPPKCELLDCPAPDSIPLGYIQADNAVGFKCAQSYTGFPQKVCQPTLSCQPLPLLMGCTQLVPCEGPVGANKCQVQMADCLSVPATETCTLMCKAPFVGNSSQAYCPEGNVDPHNLIWTAPECAPTLSCADPVVYPTGYILDSRTEEIVCAAGYAGKVKKLCVWEEVNCTALPVLSGCDQEVMCKPFKVIGMPDICTQMPATECANVKAGGTCEVFCKSPYDGSPSTYTCPTGNVAMTQELVGSPAVCDCPDPSFIPPGYNNTGNGWACAAGYLGEAVKLCSPSASCMPNPTLTGCTAPVVCEVAPFDDQDERNQHISGYVSFGPLLVNNQIDESAVVAYHVFWADHCDRVLGEAIGSIYKEKISDWLFNNNWLMSEKCLESADESVCREDELSGAGGAGTFLCCRDDVYGVKIPTTSLAAEPQKTHVIVKAETNAGFAQVGRSIPLTDKFDPSFGIKASVAVGANPTRGAVLVLSALALWTAR